MTQAARAKMYADPNVAFFVAHQIDVMIAAADCAELRLSFLLVVGSLTSLPQVRREQRVIDPLFVHAAEAGNDGPDRILDLLEFGVELDRHIAARDVEADAGRADLIAIGVDAAHRLRIAKVPVRTDDASSHVAVAHAILHLADCGCIMLPDDDGGRRIGVLFCRGGEHSLFSRDLFGSRYITIVAPCRAPATFADTTVRVDAGGRA